MFYGSTSGGLKPLQMYGIFKKFLSAAFDKLNTIDYIIQFYEYTFIFIAFETTIRNLK